MKSVPPTKKSQDRRASSTDVPPRERYSTRLMSRTTRCAPYEATASSSAPRSGPVTSSVISRKVTVSTRTPFSKRLSTKAAGVVMRGTSFFGAPAEFRGRGHCGVGPEPGSRAVSPDR
jgi:hypothetical protein